MKVFSNLAISADGKIADRRDPTRTLGTKADKDLMNVVRRRSDVIVVGADTLRAHPHPLRVKGKGKKKQPANAVITMSGDLDPRMPFWDAEDVVRFVFTTRNGFERALRCANDRAMVLLAGEESVDPACVLERLKASGLEEVLVEGGGEIMALFLEARLLHELYLTFTPWLLGGRGNPTLVGGPGLDEWAKLKILSTKRVKDEVFFRLGVKGARRV